MTLQSTEIVFPLVVVVNLIPGVEPTFIDFEMALFLRYIFAGGITCQLANAHIATLRFSLLPLDGPGFHGLQIHNSFDLPS